MDNKPERRPTFFWRGLLIVLPVILLAGAGLYSLKQDRLLAEIDAKERCQNITAIQAGILSSRLFSELKQLDLEIMSVDRNGFLREIDGSPSRAHLIVPAVHPENKNEGTHVTYEYGLNQLKSGEPQKAIALFRAVESNTTAATETGQPLWLLAEWQLAQLEHSNLDGLYQDLLNNPCFFTEAILDHLAEMDPHPATQNTAMLDIWHKDEATRDFYTHIESDIKSSPAPWRSFWTIWNGNQWLVLMVPAKIGAAVKAFAETSVIGAASNVLSHSSVIPPYAQLRVDILNRPLYSAATDERILSHSTGAIVPELTNSLVVSAVLSAPTILYAQQRTRSLWFAALILVASTAALVGFVSAYRGFHQQLRLSEMKTNFVSSVSHELRAPIASMRLLAESLERGKVNDSVKQKEYFSFLVQESRRLSSLIENILDFSRIEQGRKRYHIEPTDLDVLVAQTITLMRPGASERGVELVQEPAAKTGTVVSCDGLAIQQALLNLIDNAIKHSAANSRVTVGLEHDANTARLWVEDHGPGIPPEEHERIFERFYRRGSELRRETQGIGIGLAIVKHTIEAHGGRIVVRSAVGQGSLFTIELPMSPALPTQET